MGARSLRVVRDSLQRLLAAGKATDRNPFTSQRNRRVSLLHLAFDCLSSLISSRIQRPRHWQRHESTSRRVHLFVVAPSLHRNRRKHGERFRKQGHRHEDLSVSSLSSVLTSRQAARSDSYEPSKLAQSRRLTISGNARLD